MIFGVTGQFCAGKDVVADILQKMNFFHVSFSDLIREELKKQGKKLGRDNERNMGNALRAEHGASVLARMALDKVVCGENYVFTSIRNPEEVKTLLEKDDFILVKVVASERSRFERMQMRKREGDPKSVAEMREKEKKENSSDPNAQQLNKVFAKAKIVVSNDTSLEALEKKVHKMVEDWLFKLQPKRPEWDTYFMNIADQVKERCSCMSAKKAALIVKEKQIISTGYNGPPKGITHCTAGGCPRCTSRHLGKIETGVYSEPCICAHGEENAIVQAAYTGMSTKGATMYTTHSPCVVCCKLIINAGIKRVVGKVKYNDDVGLKMLKEAGVKFELFKGPKYVK